MRAGSHSAGQDIPALSGIHRPSVIGTLEFGGQNPAHLSVVYCVVQEIAMVSVLTKYSLQVYKNSYFQY